MKLSKTQKTLALVALFLAVVVGSFYGLDPRMPSFFGDYSDRLLGTFVGLFIISFGLRNWIF